MFMREGIYLFKVPFNEIYCNIRLKGIQANMGFSITVHIKTPTILII